MKAKAFLLPFALVALAEFGARAAGPSDSIAPPSEVLAAFLDAVRDGSLVAATRDTLISAFGGLILGASLGLIFGLALGSLRTLDRLLELALELLRPIPSVAVIPIPLVPLGFGYRLRNRYRRGRVLLAAPDSVARGGARHRAAFDRGRPRLASVTPAGGYQNRRASCSAPNLSRFPAGGRHLACRRSDD
jgi:hypothetical protein